MMENIENRYSDWNNKAAGDKDIIKELDLMMNDSVWKQDAFYRDLSFGTAGIRGVMGAGTNRINIYTVARTSQGIVNYIVKNKKGKVARIAIAYDSRRKSKLFAETAARVFAANGMQVEIYGEIMPTPCLSYAVRSLNCDLGVVITASHNPPQYNGYKVYDSKGCQINTQVADLIVREINRVDIFKDIKWLDFDIALKEGYIKYISDDIYFEFIEEVKKQTLIEENKAVDKDISIVYSPLNGTGAKPVQQILSDTGYTNISVVKEQKEPDGDFTTCKSPNPESKEAMFLSIKYAQEKNADIAIATDPDCDRVGVAIKTDEQQYRLLTGNEVGILLLDYICSQHIKNNTMPKDALFVKTIVSSDMAESIADNYGVKTINVLTGFKYIGEQIGLLDECGKTDSYIFGFEESCGYLTGTYVRDKDAVNGVFMICEMAAVYKAKGISLAGRLQELYRTYGYNENFLYTYEFQKNEDIPTLETINKMFEGKSAISEDFIITHTIDYSVGVDNLPKENVLKIVFNNDTSIIIRPSGTEPKLKIYCSIKANDNDGILKKERKIREIVDEIVNQQIQADGNILI